ncbi:MAG: NAD(P)-dependent oxidoreductase [Planctomycetes bacterium]|nr:NAD(P)-dependent oxidoreductase [Planctomycetota bacterium]
MGLVLITGVSGEVGRGVVPLLERQFELRLLALDEPHDPRGVCADLLDWEALSRALEGVEAVLHLAVAPGYPGTYEDDAFNDLRFDVNVKGTFHVFEAARRAGVRRVVHVSSLMVVWGYGAETMVLGDAPVRPVGTYALTKALGEEIARHYASRGLEVVTLRIAAPLDISDPKLRHKPVRPQQVPFPDLAKAFALALTVPLSGYEVVTIVGESSRRVWDLGPARRVLGYVPQYRLDDLGVQFADAFDVPPRVPGT